jgi:6-phosphogluconolactonase
MASAKREVVVVADPEAVAREAASRIIDRVSENERPAVCLSGGTTPMRIYELLGASPYRERIPWDRVHWFVGDERFVPLDDPLSNMGNARKALLDGRAPVSHVHPMPTSTSGLNAAALQYERELQGFYGADRLDPARPLFDLVLLGVGPDGHVASLFPGVSPDDNGRWVIGVPMANVAPFVPRVSLTFPVLASCRQMLFLVAGANKRAIFEKVQRGDDLPATHAHSNMLTTWLVDRAAAGDVA